MTPVWMTEEGRAEAMKWLEEWNPEQFLEVNRFQRRNPVAVTEVLREALEQKEELARVEKDDPARFALMKEERALAKQVLALRDEHRNALPERKAGKEAELRKLLDQQFDKKLAIHRLEANQLEKELQELRGRLEKRAQQKTGIVDRRLVELTEEKEWMDW